MINAALAHLGLDPFIMLNTRFGTLVGYLTLCLPLVVILQTFSLAAVDRTLIEAAHNLGCGRIRTVFTVIVPLAKVGLIIGAVFCFILSFLRRGQRGLQEADLTSDRAITLFLRLYVCVVFCFVFAPIAASFVFSFNSDRFPTIPLGSFTLHWYETVYNDADVWDALGVSLSSAFTVSVISTFIGFCTAYTDYRYRFFGKSAYLALALLPPTIPLVIMGLAMLAWLSHVGLSGRPISIIVAHVVLCTPFAMAIVR